VSASERSFLVEEQIKPDEDVEAHKHKRGLGPKATDEATEEGTESGSDDFELHKRSKSAMDEGGESGDDDVELHKKFSKK
jgi:hypothetical protein